MSGRPDMADWWHKVRWHLPLDWYCNRLLPGWGRLQVQQHNACTRYEDRRPEATQ